MTSVQIQPNIRPMTPAERAMYAAYALHPESTAYLLEVSLELIGGLDVERLGKAIGDLADHHDVLKSTYAFDGVGFTRTVREDLKTRLQAHTETSAKDSAGRSSSKPFDLAREVPMRAELFHNATHRHMLVLTFHHIACDAVSISLILTTLENLYNGAAVRADVEQPVVPSDTEQRLRAEKFIAALPTTASLDLPIDHPRPAERSLRGSMVQFEIDRDTADRLRQLAQQERATLSRSDGRTGHHACPVLRSGCVPPGRSHRWPRLCRCATARRMPRQPRSHRCGLS